MATKESQPATDWVYPQLARDQGEFMSWRRDIHAHPELGFEEHRTAELIKTGLHDLGIEVHEGLGRTGLVGRLRKGGEGPTIGLRADMDALPMEELNDFSHRSIHPGKFHGCGHDGHTVMLLAAARHLARETQFNGEVLFIFQPAEEGLGGAKHMIEDGLFERFPMDAVYALHNAPGLPAGDYALLPGPMLAAFEKFDITVNGQGSHGAMPEQGVDPILIAAQLVQAFQSIVSRSLQPIRAGVVSVTRVQAGDAYNVIPDRLEMSGAIRYLEPGAGEVIKRRMQELVSTLPLASGGTANLNFHELGYPALINDSRCARVATEVARSLVGPKRVDETMEPVMGSEDFAYMLQQCPGCYLLIGNGEGSRGGCMVHHPQYDFNDDIIPMGASFWVRLVETVLA